MSSTNIQIAIKVRPFIEREKREKREPFWLVKENNIVQIDNTQSFIGEPYSFDHIFDDTKSNKDVYDAVVKPLVMSCLEGINSTIFAYGQTSSGKTHTMLGDKDIPGIVKFTVDDIFTYMDQNTTKNFLLRCSYIEIYNEKINDLLDRQANDIKIREDYNQGVYVVVKEEVIREPEELFNLMKKGMKTRKIGCTDMNERSSRSHTIFKLVIQSQNKESEGSYTESTLSLVDLAGSERVGQMNMGRERQVEGVSINKSLTTLGLVIRKLSENEPFINYRDSKLTRLLQQSLGGNSRTLIIATITVAASEETKSTLDFAQRAKYVKNRPIINEKVTDKDQLKQYEHLCEDYKDQIDKLRMEKIERDRTINVLEDKISNIKLFTAGNFERFIKPSRIPNRRHTLGHYKPQRKIISTINSEGVEENSDSEDLAKIISPVKSEICLPVTNIEDKENSFFDNKVFNTPSKLIVRHSPCTPETPSTLKVQKELLEESYSNLISFTNLEKQLQRNSNELEEFRELIDQLRNENSQLKEENLKQSEIYTKVIEDNRDVYEKLISLKNILDVKPFEEMQKKFLHTIIEEEFFSNDFDEPICINEISDSINEGAQITAEKKYETIIEENHRLRQQVNENEIIIDAMKKDFNAQKTSRETICTKLEEENDYLKSQIDIKNATIDKLKVSIIQDKDVKEAELEILNNKIKKLNDYKEVMHIKLSELQNSLSDEENIVTVQLLNTTLKQDLENLRKKYDELKQLAEFDAIKLGELEIEINYLKSDKDDFVCEKELELATLRNTNDDLLSQLKEKNNQIDEYCLLKEENENLKTKLKDEKFKQNVDELILVKETCESLQHELIKSKKQLECTSLQLQEKTDLYNTVITSNSEKNIVIENLEKEMQELNGKLDEFSTLPSIDELKQLLAERSKEIEKLEKDKCQLVECIDNTSQKEAEIHKSMLDNLNAEVDELRRQLHSKIKELDEMTNVYNEVILKYNCTLVEHECLTNENMGFKKELNNLSEMRQKETEQTVFDKDCELSRLKKENEELLRELDRKLNEESNFKKESERLKSELEDALFQLSGEQKELESYYRQVEDKARSIVALEQIIYNLKNDREQQMKKLQELTNVNSTLNKDLVKKEEQIKKLHKISEEALKTEGNSLRETENEEEENAKSIQRFNDNTSTDHLMDTHVIETHRLQAIPEEQLTEIAELKNNLHSKKSTKDENIEIRKKENMKFNEIVLNKTVHNYLKDIQVQTMSDDQKTEIIELKEQLHSKVAEFNTYLKQIETLKNSLENKEVEIKDLKDQLDSRKYELDKKTDSYNELLSSYNNKVGKYQLQIEDEQKTELRQMTDDDNKSILEQNIKGYQKDIQVLQITCEEQKTEINELRNQLHSKITELDEKNTLYNAMVEENKHGAKEIEDFKKESKQLKISLEQVIENYVFQILNIVSEERKTEIDELKNQLYFKGEKVNYYTELSGCNTRVGEYQQSVEDILDSYRKDVDILQLYLKTEIDKLSRQLQSKIIELDEKTNSYNELFLNYNTTVAECQQREKEIENLVDEHKDLQKIVDKNSSLEETVNGYLTKIEVLTTVFEEQKTIIDELKNQSSSKVTELSIKTDSYNELFLNYNTTVADYQKREKEIEDLADKNKHLQQIIDNNTSLKETVNSYLTKIEVLRTASEEQKTIIEELKNQLSSKVIELSKKTDSYNELLSDYNTMVGKYNQSVKEIEIIKEEKIQLTKLLDDKADLEQTVDKYLRDIHSLQSAYENQESKLRQLTNQLDSRELELRDKTDSYGQLLSNYNNKVKECAQWVKKIDSLEEENMQLKQYTDNNASLEQRIHNYLKDIEILQVTSKSQAEKINELESQLHLKSSELKEKTKSYNNVLSNYKDKLTEYESLVNENTELKKQLNTWTTQQNKPLEKAYIENENLGLSEKPDQNLNKEPTPSSYVTDKQVEAKGCHALKSEETESLDKFVGKVRELELELSDTKRQLKERCLDYLDVNRKCNALEIQLINCKNDLKIKNKELQDQKTRIADLVGQLQDTDVLGSALTLENPVDELVSKTKRLSEELENVQKEVKLKTLQLSTANEEIKNIKFNYEQCKLTLQEIQQKHKEFVSNLKEKSSLQDKLRTTECKVITLEQALQSAKNRLKNSDQLNIQLGDFKKRYDMLESHFNAEKSNVISLKQKLHNSESEVSNLQTRVNDFLRCKKGMQDHQHDVNPVLRLSDEGTSLSPNELRKNKRHSLHDQRRGLTTDLGNVEDDNLECLEPYCQELKKKFEVVLEKNRQLMTSLEDIRKNNESLKSENECMKRQVYAFPAKDVTNLKVGCSECIELQNRMSAIETEMEELKKENKFLDKENDDMLKIIREMEQTESQLYEQLEKCNSSSDVSGVNTELTKMQASLSDLMKKNAELQKELLDNKEVIERYKNKITQLENSKVEAQYQKADLRQTRHYEDKETQAVCDLHQKYRNVQRIAESRRKEANYLRAQLNLPKDCPVLPEDVQRHQKRANLKDNAP